MSDVTMDFRSIMKNINVTEAPKAKWVNENKPPRKDRKAENKRPLPKKMRAVNEDRWDWSERMSSHPEDMFHGVSVASVRNMGDREVNVQGEDVMVAIMHDGSGYTPQACVSFAQGDWASYDELIQDASEGLEEWTEAYHTKHNDWEWIDKDAEELGMDRYEFMREGWDGFYFKVPAAAFKVGVENTSQYEKPDFEAEIEWVDEPMEEGRRKPRRKNENRKPRRTPRKKVNEESWSDDPKEIEKLNVAYGLDGGGYSFEKPPAALADLGAVVWDDPDPDYIPWIYDAMRGAPMITIYAFAPNTGHFRATEWPEEYQDGEWVDGSPMTYTLLDQGSLQGSDRTCDWCDGEGVYPGEAGEDAGAPCTRCDGDGYIDSVGGEWALYGAKDKDENFDEGCSKDKKKRKKKARKNEGYDSLMGKAKEFADACINDNSVEELEAALKGGPDKGDMKEWGLTPGEWRAAIQAALQDKKGGGANESKKTVESLKKGDRFWYMNEGQHLRAVVKEHRVCGANVDLQVREGRAKVLLTFAKGSTVRVVEWGGRRNQFAPGTRVQVGDVAGVFSRQKGVVVNPRDVPTSGRGIPQIPGAYDKLKKDDVVIKLDSGEMTIYDKRYLKVIGESKARGTKHTPRFKGPVVERRMRNRNSKAGKVNEGGGAGVVFSFNGSDKGGSEDGFSSGRKEDIPDYTPQGVGGAIPGGLRPGAPYSIAGTVGVSGLHMYSYMGHSEAYDAGVLQDLAITFDEYNIEDMERWGTPVEVVEFDGITGSTNPVYSGGYIRAAAPESLEFEGTAEITFRTDDDKESTYEVNLSASFVLSDECRYAYEDIDEPDPEDDEYFDESKKNSK